MHENLMYKKKQKKSWRTEYVFPFVVGAFLFSSAHRYLSTNEKFHVITDMDTNTAAKMDLGPLWLAFVAYLYKTAEEGKK